jgi:hypothetical protein
MTRMIVRSSMFIAAATATVTVTVTVEVTMPGLVRAPPCKEQALIVRAEAVTSTALPQGCTRLIIIPPTTEQTQTEPPLSTTLQPHHHRLMPVVHRVWMLAGCLVRGLCQCTMHTICLIRHNMILQPLVRRVTTAPTTLPATSAPHLLLLPCLSR